MKSTRWIMVLLFLVAAIGMIVATEAAQDVGTVVLTSDPPILVPAPAPAVSPEQVVGFLDPLINALTAKYGWIVTIFTVIGLMRVFFKPVFALVELAVAQTPSDKDDAAIAHFKAGPIYRWVVFLLDWLGSIKSPKLPTTNPLVKPPV